MNWEVDLKRLWGELEQEYQKTLSPPSFDTWIKTAKPLTFTDNQLVIEVPSKYHLEYWQNNLATTVVQTGYRLTGQDILPLFVIKEDEKKEIEKSRPVATVKTSSEKNGRKTLLNPKYTFDTFVIGKGNQMAHAAALVVADSPGTSYNPLFFYGGVGLGKTHLMQAIGHAILEKNPDAQVRYVSSETFTNDFINSIKNNQQEAFRQSYRSIDLLLVDDIQFFSDKEGTQEEFFHTFNALYNDQKQIVLSSDRLPNEIPKLQDRLVSRFAWGLSVDITPPDLETRIAILRKKADSEDLEFPEETLSYIAGQIDSNIRELEGALVRVQAYAATMGNTDITTSLAADALKSLKTIKNPQKITIPFIQEEVCKFYHVQLKDLKGKKRQKSIVIPRQIAMYLARELTDSSLPKIGAEFGGKDHTTVLHAHEKIQKLLESDDLILKEVNELKEIIKI